MQQQSHKTTNKTVPQDGKSAEKIEEKKDMPFTTSNNYINTTR